MSLTPVLIAGTLRSSTTRQEFPDAATYAATEDQPPAQVKTVVHAVVKGGTYHAVAPEVEPDPLVQWEQDLLDGKAGKWGNREFDFFVPESEEEE